MATDFVGAPPTWWRIRSNSGAMRVDGTRPAGFCGAALLHAGTMKNEMIALVCLAALEGCGGSSSHTMLTRTAETPENLTRVMRGGSRVGCETSGTYDGMMGIFIDCEGGRMVVGKPSGENMKATGDPLEVNCFDGLSDPKTCESLWKKVMDAGQTACKAGETGPGCGELKCSGAADQHSCKDVLESK